MLKRQDLAKQFEDIVKQEIVNYNNSLNTVYQKLNSLKTDIDELREQSLESDALLMSKLKELEINFEIYRSAIHDQNQKLSNKVGVLEGNVEKTHDNLDNFISNVHEIDQRSEDNRKNIHFLKQKDDSRIEEYECFCKSISQQIELEKYSISRKLEKLKEEVLSKPPSEALEIKRQLENKLNSHVVDVEGVNRSILLMSHSIMVAEKKIENIYMLIDRMNKGENR